MKSEFSARRYSVTRSAPASAVQTTAARSSKKACRVTLMSGLPAEHRDAAELAGGRCMAHTDHLRRLALSAEWRSHHLEGRRVAHHGERTPEGGTDAAVVRVAHHLGQSAVADDLPVLAAELELVARVVDAPGAVG